MNLASRRTFAAAASEYQSVDGHNKVYQMAHPVQFAGKTVNVFNGEDCKERRFVPWEIKEAAFKSGMGVIGTNMLNMIFPLGHMYGAAQVVFCLNFVRTSWSLMNNAVTKIDLHDDGKNVTLTFGRTQGRTQVVAIKDIQKVLPMRNLVETFEESTMYPIQIGGKTVYLNGPGQEAIRNGELFRAIVNGQHIKF